MDITPELIKHLRESHSRTTRGDWVPGQTGHDTVARNAGRTDYRVADFRHADDASFVDLAHACMPALLDEIERLRAPRVVEFDDSLNNLAWTHLEFLQVDGAVSPRVFNNLKVELHRVIQTWLDEHR